MALYQVALITGAAAGIGRALALELAGEGVAIADVTDSAVLALKTRELEKELGPIDLLIANAGIGSETSALRFDAEATARIIGVNLIGVANSLAAVLPGMLQRKRGHLVAISS